MTIQRYDGEQEKAEMDELRSRREAGISEYSVSHVEGLGDRIQDYRKRWKKAESRIEELERENARSRERVAKLKWRTDTPDRELYALVCPPNGPGDAYLKWIDDEDFHGLWWISLNDILDAIEEAPSD